MIVFEHLNSVLSWLYCVWHGCVLDGGAVFDWMTKWGAIVSGDAGYCFCGCGVNVGVNFNLIIATVFCQWYQNYSITKAKWIWTLSIAWQPPPGGGGCWILQTTSYCVKPLVSVQLFCEMCLVDHFSIICAAQSPLYLELILYPRVIINSVFPSRYCLQLSLKVPETNLIYI